MIPLLFITALTVADPSPEQKVEAEILYRDGSTKYESADYNGAIEDFTKVLGIMTESDGNEKTRLSLLYNIATAHEKAFKIDQDLTHLRQALLLYNRFLEFAHKTGNLEEQLDVKSKIAHLRAQLETPSSENKVEALAPEPLFLPVRVKDPGPDWKKPRNLGIGLVISGGAVTIGGIVLAVLGSQLEGQAQAQVNGLADQDIPMDHPAWAEGEAFVTSEKRRGGLFMGLGASVAIVGATGIGVGTYYLVKSKRLRESRLAVLPSFSPRLSGIHISGQF